MKILSIGPKGIMEKYNTDPTFFDRHTVVEASTFASTEEKLAIASDADLIVADAISPVPADLIQGMPNLKFIQTNGVAYNRVDVEAAKECGVYVCNCKGMNALPVAEHAIMLMIGLLRDVVVNDRKFREGDQIKVKEGYMKAGSLRELGDCTIGLLGFGDIARELAKLANHFGAKVIYYNRHRATPEIEQELGVEYRTLDELLAESDIVSVHLPVTEETTGLVNKDFFGKMKEGSYIVNTARGEILDEYALLDALRSGRLAGAALDTVIGEPVSVDHPLLSAEPEVEDKIIFSCHLGGITASSFKRGYDMIFENISRLERGEELIKRVW